MQPIYKPKGRAEEYCELALNIYTGCTHGCTYCYAAKNAHRWGRNFTNAQSKEGIVEAVKAQLARGTIKDKLIHLCFTCDPYPYGVDDTVTREVIEVIKNSGNHVQILTKAGDRAMRDFDLLDENDWFGVTITGDSDQEPLAAHELERRASLFSAKQSGINTWVSCEPVFRPEAIYELIADGLGYIDHFKIGKLNHYHSDIDWSTFGKRCEFLCDYYGRSYYIKEDLRKEMVNPMPNMNLFTAPGELLFFTGVCGLSGQSEQAKKYLRVGLVYTLERVEIHKYVSYVYLREHPGKPFNSVMFQNATKPKEVEDRSQYLIIRLRKEGANGH